MLKATAKKKENSSGNPPTCFSSDGTSLNAKANGIGAANSSWPQVHSDCSPQSILSSHESSDSSSISESKDKKAIDKSDKNNNNGNNERNNNTSRSFSSASSTGSFRHAIVNRYTEEIRMGGRQHSVAVGRLIFAKHDLVREIASRSRAAAYPKQAQRSTPSGWRRYGPLHYIHLVGGWINDHNANGNKAEKPDKNNKWKDYVFVKPGTRMPQPPNEPLHVLCNDRAHRHCDPTLQVPTNCTSPSDAAHAVSLQLSDYITNRWAEFTAAKVDEEHRRHEAGGENVGSVSTPVTTASAELTSRSQSADGSQKLRSMLKVVQETPLRLIQNIFRISSSSAGKEPLKDRVESNSENSLYSKSNKQSKKVREKSKPKERKRTEKTARIREKNNKSAKNTTKSDKIKSSRKKSVKENSDCRE